MSDLVVTYSTSVVQPGIFLGLYSATFIHGVRWVLFEDEGWRVRKKINWWQLITTLLVFLLSMALFCAVVMEIDGFAVAYYLASTTLSSSAIQWSILVAIDSVMIYRCWVVFSENWFIICFPVVLWCFCLTCEILSFYCYVVHSFNVPASPSVQRRMCWGKYKYISLTPLAFYVSNIIINIYTTSALVYKIWRTAKNKPSTNRLCKICRILTESGMLYTLSSIACLISWILSYDSIYGAYFWQLPYMAPGSVVYVPFGLQIALGVLMFIPGIAFNLVIIRVGEQRSKGEDTWVDFKEASKALTHSEPGLFNHPDIPTEGEMGQASNEKTNEGEAMEINEMEDREIMEVDRRLDLEG